MSGNHSALNFPQIQSNGISFFRTRCLRRPVPRDDDVTTEYIFDALPYPDQRFATIQVSNFTTARTVPSIDKMENPYIGIKDEEKYTKIFDKLIHNLKKINHELGQRN